MSQTRRKFLQSLAAGTGVMASTSSTALPSVVADAPRRSEQQGRASGPREPSPSSEKFFAQAVGFEQGVVYRPAQRPGFSSWVAAWHGSDGSLLLSFSERRHLPNPVHRPVPVDFWESMGLPIKYQSQLCNDPNILPETVVLQSLDQGNNWKEVGRSLLIMQPLAYASLSDGSILRGIDNAYHAYYPQEKVTCTVQKSTDLGNTWQDLAVVAEDLFFNAYRLRALRDGALVLLGGLSGAFGPGRSRFQRTETRANVRMEHQAAFYYSYDLGVNWEGPIPVFPGIEAWEPDWVELPSGDLLLINSDVQAGANTRQIVRRQGKRFIPGPVLDIVSGPVPETVVLTKEGLLVGARRGGVYSCSKDEGNTWYPIGGLPKSLYQPRILQLADGRLCNFFHLGGDNIVGEIDQYVGQHVFRLEEHVPRPTTLALSRDKNAAQTQYVNAYTATLRAGDQPLANQDVQFTVRAASRGRKTYQTETFTRRTDAAGQARIALREFDQCIDIHRDYYVQAEFTSPAQDPSLAPARSNKYLAYRLTSTAGKKNTYDFYVAGRQLFVSKDRLEKFPEIQGLVKAFGLKPRFTEAELASELKLDRERSKLFIDTLLQHHVLRAGKDGAFAWNEVELTEVRPIAIEDDFIS